MKNDLFHVLIVDDEPIIRQGLKNTIEWGELGFAICGEAGNGEEAIQKIEKYDPDLVLLDIRMPKMTGTEIMEKVRSNGYTGHFIILSGYSDFKYAQTALHFGASFYLTKPIDEDELQNAVVSVKEEIIRKRSKENSLHQYATKAKKSILVDLLKSPDFDNSINYAELGLSSFIYQVVLYESYTPYYASYNFADMLRVTNQDNQAFEEVSIDNHNVVILKGDHAIERFNNCLDHYKSGTEKGSPLDILFLTYGPATSNLSSLHDSYDTCCKLMSRRFFCARNQHVLSYDEMPDPALTDITLDSKAAKTYSEKFVNYIQSFNRRNIAKLIESLSNDLYNCNEDVDTIKYFLIDIFLQIKQAITYNYSSGDIPFAHNAAIMETLTKMYYLHEIMTYFNDQFEMIMRAIGNSSRESVLDDILYYIGHNYQESIKLETLATLFGYNSSYLGKLFKDKIGQSFNSYLDQVRIENAVKLLEDTDLRIYEISSRVGYKNVDYFQQKFKKIKGVNPTDYRTK